MFRNSVQLSPLIVIGKFVQDYFDKHKIKYSIWSWFIQYIIMAIPLSCILLYTLYPIFTSNVNNIYNINWYGNTNILSILINASLILTLIPPLAYNFYLLVNVTQNAFFQVVGEMKLLPIFGVKFHLYFPSFICLAIFFTYTRIFSRILISLSIPVYHYYNIDSILVHEQLRDGISFFNHYIRSLHQHYT